MKRDIPEAFISPEMQPFLDEFTNKLSEAIHCLQMWSVLNYTGHFIDVHPEMRSRIDPIVEQTNAVLAKFGVVVPK